MVNRTLAAWVQALVVVIIGVSVGVVAAASAHDDSLAGIDWQPCSGEPVLDCAVFEVPLDHDDPDGPTIELVLVRRRADDPSRRIGTLLWNPGGPGASAIDMASADDHLAGLGERFDIISMDPRGIGYSTPVACDNHLDDVITLDPLPGDAAAREELDEAWRTFARSCAERSGDLLAHVGTADVVEDMEHIRVALGEEQLNFVGFSYGTYLGAAYADAYPERVRAFVLDGAVDPEQAGFGLIAVQAEGLERAINAFLDDCAQTPDCPLNPDPHARYDAFVERLAVEPVASSDPTRTVGLGEFAVAIGNSASAGEVIWPLFATAIADAIAGDGDALLLLADQSSGRNPDGSYKPVIGAQAAVACLDPLFPTTPNETEAVEEHIRANAPRARAAIEFSWRVCDEWAVPARPAPRFEAHGAAPILVIGTTLDPATPYEWSVALAEQLESGVLLTAEGTTHTSFTSDECVDEIVREYMFNLNLPASGARCRS